MAPLGELRRLAPYWSYRVAAAVARALPPALARVAAVGAGRVAERAMADRRRMAERNLRRVHGGALDDEAIRHEVHRAFVSYARYWLESFRLPGTDPTRLEAGMSWEGIDHLDAALAQGNGVIVALPHLGGWDFGGAWLASIGYPATVVVESLEPPELFEWFAQLRRALGLTIVPLGPAAGTAILRTLRQGGVVGLVSDRDILGTGVEVDLFGERTTLPSGPATLALRTGAAILPAAIYFDGPRSHRGVMRPPVPAERQGSLREDVARITQALAAELEALIRAAPDQWHLFQPNWPSDRAASGR